MQTATTTLRIIASLLFLKLIFCIKLFNAGKRPGIYVKGLITKVLQQ